LGAAVALGLPLLRICPKEVIKLLLPIGKSPPILPFLFEPLNLLNPDYSCLSKYLDVDFLAITAGFGRVDYFQNLEPKEIDNLTTVDALAVAKILKIFYGKISGNSPFHTLVMGSIAGLISSPLFSVYGASKAYVCKLIESLNVELEYQKCPNRILNVSPGSLKGTSFNGGKTDLSSLDSLVDSVLEHVFAKDTLFVPDIATYGSVLERYEKDPHAFGLSSIEYKIKNNRINPKPQLTIGYLSGTFDLFHIGHLNVLKRAKQYCDYLVVGVHKDGSHKGKEVFIPLEERKEIVRSIKYVDEVIDSLPEDSDVWPLIHYNYLFVGSDYKGSERFNRYEEYFKDKGVQIVYFPYTQGTSSTKLREALSAKISSK
jgi:glycerol-3-phosphate cytidylyltransferase